MAISMNYSRTRKRLVGKYWKIISCLNNKKKSVMDKQENKQHQKEFHFLLGNTFKGTICQLSSN